VIFITETISKLFKAKSVSIEQEYI